MSDTDSRWKKLNVLIISAVTLIASGCSSLLPSVKETTRSRYWNTFDDAKLAFEKIIPFQTKTEELHGLGFDPFSTPNIRILTYLDIIQRFMSNSSLKIEDFDEGIQTCIKARADCKAYEVRLRNISRKRHGNVLLDIFNFKRSTNQSGWEFEAFVVISDGTVVYKLWGGKPIIDENKVVKNPLGPLQDPSGILRDETQQTILP